MTIQNYKKKYLICKDDFGKNIYVGDTVELFCPLEFSTTWKSIVYWSMLSGAWVDFPTIFIDTPNPQRILYSLLNQQEYNICDVDSDIPIKYKGYCKKIKSFYTK